jgi:Tol biopolymer transport system component/DNA-binding winged helix-turn-helix (wHTH) protein
MATTAPQTTGPSRFGPFELDPLSGELRKSGVRIALQDQPLAILRALLAAPGQIVTRDELRHRLWPDDTFVDFEHGLNAAIKRLRDTLGDSADTPRFIETVPRRGYRFVGPLQGTLAAVPTLPAPTSGNDVSETDAGAHARSNVAPSRVAEAPAVASRHASRRRWLLIAGVLLVPLAATAGLVYALRPLPPPRITRTREVVLRSGMQVGRLVTDGTRIYFTERGPEGVRLYQVSVAGGEPVRLPLPGIPDPFVSDLSTDGAELLVRAFTAGDARYWDDPLWVVSLPGGNSRRLGDVLAHDAVWSPDGLRLAYAQGTGVYVAERDGSRARKLFTQPTAVGALRWSPDGTRLRFLAPDAVEMGLVWWEGRTDGSDLRRVLVGWPAWPSVFGPQFMGSSGAWTSDGRYFALVSSQGPEVAASVWGVREAASRVRRASPNPVQLTTGPISYTGVSPDPDGRRLFVTGQQRRGELVRVDAGTQELRPFLSGISAEMLDFSKDGEWVAYTGFPDGTLWRSRVGGEERRQLTHPPMQAAGPRWSPDGRRIAFMASERPRDNFDVYVVSADGGGIERLVPGVGPAGDPSWAPDGRALAFDHWEAAGPRIRLLDVGSGRVEALPGAGGLFSARWSPTGRHIAALARREKTNGLMLYDLATRQWTTLYDAGGADWPSWSRDGVWVYFWATTRTGESGLGRVRVSDRRLEPVATPRGLVGEGMFGVPWWGLAPDGSLLTLRSTSFWGIYALDWETP